MAIFFYPPSTAHPVLEVILTCATYRWFIYVRYRLATKHCCDWNCLILTFRDFSDSLTLASSRVVCSFSDRSLSTSWWCDFLSILTLFSNWAIAFCSAKTWLPLVFDFFTFSFAISSRSRRFSISNSSILKRSERWNEQERGEGIII